MLESAREDLERIMRTAPAKLSDYYSRTRIIARRGLIKVREIFVEDEEIRKLITLDIKGSG